MDRAINQVIKDIVPKDYFLTLMKHHTRYVIVRSLGILKHIHANYGMLKDDDVQDIYMALKTPINEETHFGYFLSQIKDN